MSYVVCGSSNDFLGIKSTCCGDGQTSRLTGAHNNAFWEFPNSPSHSLLGDHRHATLQRVFLDS
eukprot:scaffold37218_cov52-Cyclotella_meneghiniana.AAC.2